MKRAGFRPCTRSCIRNFERKRNVGGCASRLLLPPLRRSPSLEEGGLGKGNREFVECRRARDARPYNVAEKCNCEMRLQRWVASLQRLDAFATVGCTAVHRRGAHCAPVYLRCYNNPSRGRAKGHRGDRKAPICNRRQGRRPCPANPPDLPLRGRGTARRRWKEFIGGGRSKPPSNPNHMSDMRCVRRAYDFFCFRRIGVGRPNRPNGGFSARMTHPRPIRRRTDCSIIGV